MPPVRRVSRNAGLAALLALGLLLLATAYFTPKPQALPAAKPPVPQEAEDTQRQQLDAFLNQSRSQALPPPPPTAYVPPPRPELDDSSLTPPSPEDLQRFRDLEAPARPSAPVAADSLVQSLRSSLSPPGLKDKDQAAEPVAAGAAGEERQRPTTSPSPPLDFSALAESLALSRPPGTETPPALDRPRRSTSPRIAATLSLVSDSGDVRVLRKGAIIPAILETSINSDLRGQVTALVRRDVYDTATATTVLIPQASRLVGEISATPQFGQSRLEVLWTDLLLPGGRHYRLPDLPGADRAGATGLTGQVNNHTVKLFSSAVLLSLISAGVQLSQPQNSPTQSLGLRPTTPREVAAGSLGQQLGDVSTGLVDRALKVPPTISAPAGTTFTLQVTSDILFPAMTLARSRR